MTGITNNSGGARIDFLAYILVKTDKNSASVTAVNLAGTTLTGTTDSEGYALLTTTETGTYTVTVTESGQSETGTAVVTSNDNGAIIHVEILFRYILFTEGVNRLGSQSDWVIQSGCVNLSVGSLTVVIQGRLNGGPQGCYSGSKFDLTYYRHLVISGDFVKYSRYARFGICTSRPQYVANAGVIGYKAFDATQTLDNEIICDITNYSGEYYFFYQTDGNDQSDPTVVNKLTITEMYLSKD